MQIDSNDMMHDPRNRCRVISRKLYFKEQAAMHRETAREFSAKLGEHVAFLKASSEEFAPKRHPLDEMGHPSHGFIVSRSEWLEGEISACRKRLKELTASLAEHRQLLAENPVDSPEMGHPEDLMHHPINGHICSKKQYLADQVRIHNSHAAEFDKKLAEHVEYLKTADDEPVEVEADPELQEKLDYWAQHGAPGFIRDEAEEAFKSMADGKHYTSKAK